MNYVKLVKKHVERLFMYKEEKKMEERFLRQIQRIKEGRKIGKQEDQDRIAEWNSFNKYIQNTFFEWILNKFEMYTKQYGEIRGFTIHEDSYSSKEAKELPWSTVKAGEYYALNVHVNLPLGVGPRYQCVTYKEYFDMFYRGYTPKDARAHVVLFTPEYPNELYFKVSEPDYNLYVTRLEALFKAVCTDYECKKKYQDGYGDTYSSTIYNCQIDNAIELELTVTNIIYLEVRLL